MRLMNGNGDGAVHVVKPSSALNSTKVHLFQVPNLLRESGSEDLAPQQRRKLSVLQRAIFGNHVMGCTFVRTLSLTVTQISVAITTWLAVCNRRAANCTTHATQVCKVSRSPGKLA